MTASATKAARTSGWLRARITSLVHTTPTGAILRLAVPDRPIHLPGQHYLVRLTAADGYTAQRSYSVASAPSDPELELFVDGLPDGEVSGYLTQIARPGDTFEVRGPIGGWFVWSADRPALAVGGGSGVVPVMAMIRDASEVGRTELLTVAVAARTLVELPYADELRAFGARLLLSREASPDGRPAGRLHAADLDDLASDSAATTVFVCGSSRFAEGTSQSLLSLGVDPGSVRIERFGATG